MQARSFFWLDICQRFCSKCTGLKIGQTKRPIDKKIDLNAQMTEREQKPVKHQSSSENVIQ